MSSADLAHPLANDYLSAQLAGDRRGALDIVVKRGVEAGHTVPELHLDVIEPAQREIGRLWQENIITVAQEHLATAISQLALSHLYPYIPRTAHNGRKAVVACIEGELHDMGARMGADFLEMAGYDVHFVGANVPTKSLVQLVDQQKPDLVALSATMTFHIPALREAVTNLREAFGPKLPLIAAGPVFSFVPTLAAELEVGVWGTRADQLVTRTHEAFGW